MNAQFADYLNRKKQIVQQQQRETDEQERQFWLDPAVANSILRPVFKIARERYFGRIEKRHKEELEKLDKEYMTGDVTTMPEIPANTDDENLPTVITNLAAVHVLTDAEMRYANILKEEFAKNNTAKEQGSIRNPNVQECDATNAK